MGRIAQEQKVVEQMIRLYCKKHEHNEMLCNDCRELLDYARLRLEKCRFGDAKGTCKTCPIHCYRPEMKARIRDVMRWAGPRMLLYHPVAAISHLLSQLFAKKHPKMVGKCSEKR